MRVGVFFLMLLFCGPVLCQWQFFSFTSMTTRIELEFWEPDAARARLIERKVQESFELVNKRMNRYQEDSELSRLNRLASRSAQVVSKDLFEVLQQALAISRMSQGAFDMTFASVGYLYDFRAEQAPSSAQINERQSLINYQNIVLDPDRLSVRYLSEGVLVDLGGIAKGYAVDNAIADLHAFGVAHARVSAGGDMRLLGSKLGQPWVIGIKDPRQSDSHAVRLPLENVAVSTSGDYERFFIDETGKRIHHILSPKTGRPSKGIQSATIIGDLAVQTDGLSTAVFVLGVTAGLELINRLPGFDAIIIDEHRKMHYSDGLMPPES